MAQQLPGDAPVQLSEQYILEAFRRVVARGQFPGVAPQLAGWEDGAAPTHMAEDSATAAPAR